MNHAEKRKYLIKWLLDENMEYRGTQIPEEEGEQKRLLRGLMNVRMPGAADELQNRSIAARNYPAKI